MASARRKGAPRIGRRAIVAGAGGALLAAAGVIGVVRTRGYDLPRARAEALENLAPWQYLVVAAVARRIAAPDDPADATIPSADDVDVAGFVDRYVGGMHPLLRRDLSRLLAFIEHLAPLGAGFSSRFSKLDASAQDRVLASLESHDQGLLRGAFASVKALVFMGYYRDPRTWRIMGYAGPFVNRPAAGWY